MAITFNGAYLEGFMADHELKALAPAVKAAHEALHGKTGLGNDFLGWVDLPTNYDKEEFSRIKAAAKKIQQQADVLIVIGIGGSYLGARAVIELLKSQLYNNLKKDTPEIYFAGNNVSPSYLNEILSICEGKDVAVNVISKSGTTTEPALAFRVFKKLLEDKYGEAARERIYCTTDKARGTLKELADRMGYETFVVPDDVGGRYSVLTAVGLLPIAVAGCDLDALMAGAREAQNALMEPCVLKNDAYRYAATRFALYQKGKAMELLVSFDPCFATMAEWYKQLFGESEGKDGKGLFPGSVTFSTDLHSLGQFIQEGSKILFETFVDIKKPKQDFFIENDAANFDGLNFLSNQEMSKVNGTVMDATILAHTEGGVPCAVLEMPEITEHEVGYMIYFFEKTCAISGYLLGVNPFDQPGVESYKKNMFALLGKPGYEDRQAALKAKLSK
ncbi:MAG: glucose-6-phosphate isomerase [Oscillospiraceae bacterium]|nr:glucose-6-phosphate isomerase [Oscillospiraceae bacterium]